MGYEDTIRITSTQVLDLVNEPDPETNLAVDRDGDGKVSEKEYKSREEWIHQQLFGPIADVESHLLYREFKDLYDCASGTRSSFWSPRIQLVDPPAKTPLQREVEAAYNAGELGEYAIGIDVEAGGGAKQAKLSTRNLQWFTSRWIKFYQASLRQLDSQIPTAYRRKPELRAQEYRKRLVNRLVNYVKEFNVRHWQSVGIGTVKQQRLFFNALTSEELWALNSLVDLQKFYQYYKFEWKDSDNMIEMLKDRTRPGANCTQFAILSAHFLQAVEMNSFGTIGSRNHRMLALLTRKGQEIYFSNEGFIHPPRYFDLPKSKTNVAPLKNGETISPMAYAVASKRNNNGNNNHNISETLYAYQTEPENPKYRDIYIATTPSPDKAIGVMYKSIEVSPYNPGIYSKLGETLYNEGK